MFITNIIYISSICLFRPQAIYKFVVTSNKLKGVPNMYGNNNIVIR